MKTTILKLIDDQINQESDYIKEHEQIKCILRPLEGKTISGSVLNKHRLSAFDNDNGYTFKFVPQYGMYYIKGKYEHLIGYDSEPIITIDKNDNSRGFVYFDACHGTAAKERINQLKNINIDLMVKLFSGIKESFENLCVLFGDIERNNLGSFHNPIYYNILRAIKPDESKSYDKIKLSDFYFIRK
jgi:hypothetical protein